MFIFDGNIVNPLIYNAKHNYKDLIYTINVFFTFYVFYYITYILPFDLYKENIEYMNKYKKRYLLFIILYIFYTIISWVFSLNIVMQQQCKLSIY